jgi:hypothetical protein
MNSKERVKKILAHEEADRIPLFDAMWEDTLVRWIKESININKEKNKCLKIDCRWPLFLSPPVFY